jgi:hypothetical protein
MKSTFIARFLIAFALLTLANEATNLPAGYARALGETARVLSPALTGWSFAPATQGAEPRFRRGTESLRFQIRLDLLALGLLPLLSLFAATPRMPPGQRLGRAALGAFGLFCLDLVVVLAYPWMVRNPNAAKDITGTFLGMLTFVGGPVVLWFALTYPFMRGVWQLELPADPDG